MSQEGNQYLEEIVVAELDTKDKENLSNLIKYNEELEMLEYWLINPRIDKYDCLMFDDIIGKENMAGKITELFNNLVDSSREPRGHQ